VQKKLNRIKALLAQVAANAQLAAPRYWFLLNAAMCRSLVDTIRYTLQCAKCAFGCQMPPNAAKMLVNFFLTYLPSSQRVCMACNIVYYIIVGLANYNTASGKGLNLYVLGKLLVNFRV